MASLMELLFEDGAAWFSVPALVGTFGYAIRIALALLGIGGDDGGAGDMHTGDGMHGGDAGTHADGHAISNFGMALLSVQGVLTFAMGFGWTGLGGYRGSGWSAGVSALVGVAGGLVLSMLLVYLLRATRSLTASGNVTLDQYVGIEAEAYTVVPAAGQGRGQVMAVVGERQRYVYAVSESDEIPPRTRIKIVRANGDNTVTVRRL
ncbi:MAG: NfeD family protein [Phycisphaerae bacterium]|nr:NfeD family protein [Phycisphaerae bacterium]